MPLKVDFVQKKTDLWVKSFSIILKVEMLLSVVFYERKNIIFYEKNFKLMKNNTFNDVFCNTASLAIVSYQYFKND